MKRKRRSDEHPEVQRLIAAARNNSSSAPRKHHIVPNVYLGGWAVDGRVRVSEVDSKRSWVNSTDKAGRVTDFYRLEHEDLDPDDLPPLLFEMLLSRIESDAVPGLKALTRDQPDEDWAQLDYPPEMIVPLANFIAFQAVRGRRFRQGQAGMATDAYRLMYAQLVDKAILRTHLEQRLGREPSDEEVENHHDFMLRLASGEIRLGPAVAQATAEIGVMAQQILPWIVERNWRVYSSRRKLITGDEPVLVLGGPGTPRTEVAGFATAAVVVMPLDRTTLLAMFRPDVRLTADGEFPELTGTETAEFNRELVANASQIVFEEPDSSVGRRVVVPKWPSVTDVQSGYRLRDEPDAEVYRFYKRTRWAGCAPVPAWPIERWWHLAPDSVLVGPRREEFRLG